jgi:hypothetical protein
MFWVLVVGTMALFDSGEQRLREKWRSDIFQLRRGQQWADTRQLLKTFAWIDTCNEKAGKDVFNKMMQNSGDEGGAKTREEGVDPLWYE